MREKISKYPKLIGIVIGLIIGTFNGINMQGENFFSKIQESYLVIFLYLNLIVPALFVYSNLRSTKSISINIRERLNNYINVYSLIITMFFTSSVVRWIVLEQQNQGNSFDLICKIYMSLSIGFFIAYNVENLIRKKYIKNA